MYIQVNRAFKHAFIAGNVYVFDIYAHHKRYVSCDFSDDAYPVKPFYGKPYKERFSRGFIPFRHYNPVPVLCREVICHRTDFLVDRHCTVGCKEAYDIVTWYRIAALCNRELMRFPVVGIKYKFLLSGLRTEPGKPLLGSPAGRRGIPEQFFKIIRMQLAYSYPEIKLIRITVKNLIMVHQHTYDGILHLVA